MLDSKVTNNQTLQETGNDDGKKKTISTRNVPDVSVERNYMSRVNKKPEELYG